MKSYHWTILWIFSILGFIINSATFPEYMTISMMFFTSIFVCSFAHAYQTTKEFYTN